MKPTLKSAPLVIAAAAVVLSGCSSKSIDEQLLDDRLKARNDPKDFITRSVQAKREIKKGETISADLIYEKSVLNSDLPVGAVSGPAAIVGRPILKDVPKDQILVIEDFEAKKVQTAPPPAATPVPVTPVAPVEQIQPAPVEGSTENRPG